MSKKLSRAFNKILRSIHLLRRFAGARDAKGETLLEAIIAISIFTLIVGPASALFTSSIRTVAINRNDLIAASLADEGIEIMRNIRDSNLLKFSSKAEKCWNTIPDHDILTDADHSENNCEHTSNKIAGGDYILALDPQFLDWKLVLGTGDLVSADNEVYRLRLDEEGISGPPDCPAPDDCINYTSVYFAPPAAPPELADRGVESPFYRRVSVNYSPSNSSTDDVMVVNVLVQYRSGSSVRSIKRGLILTNQPA